MSRLLLSSDFQFHGKTFLIIIFKIKNLINLFIVNLQYFIIGLFKFVL